MCQPSKPWIAMGDLPKIGHGAIIHKPIEACEDIESVPLDDVRDAAEEPGCAWPLHLRQSLGNRAGVRRAARIVPPLVPPRIGSAKRALNEYATISRL